MFTSFSTALSALNATSTAIDVVGNNLANMNTPGFKTSAVVFRDLVTQSLGAGLGETQVGFGTAQPLTFRQFSQGALQTTSGLLDAAIQGDGFFILHDELGRTLYTRAGNFHTDKDGNLLTSTGTRVQGWSERDPITGAINSNNTIGNIIVPVGSLKAATATTSFNIDLNLNSSAAADATSGFSAPMTVYDSLGNAHTLTLKFEKTGANEWSYQIQIPGGEITGGTAGEPFDLPGASGTLEFDSAGQLISPAAGEPIEVDIEGLTNQSSNMSLTWNLFTTGGAPT
jgi:flagellar hook protein FlgE